MPLIRIRHCLDLVFLVRPSGFEPETCGLRGRCCRVHRVGSGAFTCGFVQSRVHQVKRFPARIADIAGWIVSRVHRVHVVHGDWALHGGNRRNTPHPAEIVDRSQFLDLADVSELAQRGKENARSPSGFDVKPPTERGSLWPRHFERRCHEVRRFQKSSTEQRSTGVLHEQHEMEFIGGTRLELRDEVQIEVTGFVGFSMDQQTSTADVLADAQQTGKHIGKKASAETRRSRSVPFLRATTNRHV
jgi:hypothetical protein